MPEGMSSKQFKQAHDNPRKSSWMGQSTRAQCCNATRYHAQYWFYSKELQHSHGPLQRRYPMHGITHQAGEYLKRYHLYTLGYLTSGMERSTALIQYNCLY